jgi:hypothetical protein
MPCWRGSPSSIASAACLCAAISRPRGRQPTVVAWKLKPWRPPACRAAWKRRLFRAVRMRRESECSRESGPGRTSPPRSPSPSAPQAVRLRPGRATSRIRRARAPQRREDWPASGQIHEPCRYGVAPDGARPAGAARSSRCSGRRGRGCPAVPQPRRRFG